MKAEVRLGLRLAGVGTSRGSGRFGWVRSAMVSLSAAVGSLLLLGVAAIARSETSLDPLNFMSVGMQVLLASVVAVVAVTVLVLAATAGRLSAALRDRRLANLRLLGLSPLLTRLVAAVETGVFAVVGTLTGAVAFLAVRPILLSWHPGGREWTAETLWPTWVDALLILVLVPLAVVGVSALPQRLGGRDTMSTVRRADDHRPRLWRLVPLLVGVVLALYVVAFGSLDPSAERLALFMFAGMVALGVGMILAVPILVRLLADVLVRRSESPTLVIAGRRLQAQPAAMTRVIAGLLIGLFIVTGARAFVVAFEDTPQYQAEARMHTTGQVGSVRTTVAHAASVEQHAAALEGVRGTATLPVLGTAWCGGHWDRRCLRAVVGTCHELRLAVPGLEGCRHDAPQWLTEPTLLWPGPLPQSFEWHQLIRDRAKGPAESLPAPTRQLHVNEAFVVDQADVFIPSALLSDKQPLMPRTDVEVVVAAEPGRPVHGLVTVLLGSKGVQGGTTPGTSYYDFVSGLRALVWAIATMVLAVGLLSFAIAAIDRAVARRAEVMSLQLTGVSPTVLRRTQWIEAAVPLATGTFLAISLGLLAGASYLAYGEIVDKLPWSQTATLAAAGFAAASFVAGLTVIASTPSIRPELIRTE